MKFKIARTNEIPANSMKSVKVGNSEVVLVHTKEGKYYAIQKECPHEGAPLDTGILIGNQIICPWHHACFNCKNGKVVEPPALSDLNCYDLSIIDQDIFLSLNDKADQPEKEIISTSDDRTFIIIGGGAAGFMAAKTLRREGYHGKMIMLTEDKYPPYDRTELSKKYLKGNLEKEDIYLQNGEFFEKESIELHTESKVSSLDTLTSTITLNSGSNLIYDKLLIASGCKPIVPFIPGSELEYIYTLRNIEDAEVIRKKAIDNKKCVIIGSSFIALEAASSLMGDEIEITIITKDKIPFANILGHEVGELLLKDYKNNGIKFITETEPISFLGNQKIHKVKLSNGKNIETNFILIAIGVKPSTEFIKSKTSDNGSLVVDEYLKLTNNVYVAGDLATYPDHISGENIRIEHWRSAQQQGKIAAMNMLDKNVKYNGVPFFQTSQNGQNVQYVGHAKKWDKTVSDGKIEKNNFLVYYLFKDEIKAVVGAGRDKELIVIEELFKLNKIKNVKKVPSSYEELIKILGC